VLVLLLKNPTFYNKNKFINLLSSDDQKTALTIRNGLVRAEFVAGRLLLMECIHRFDKGKTIEEKIIFNKNGKPFFSKSEIKFNISHTNKLIACAMGNNEMGIDVEDKKRDISSLASTILNTKQIKKYRSLNLNDRKQYLLKQ
jgi:4'-phosphopantetheinyl transferase